MANVGVAELIIVLAIAALCAVPVVAAVWTLLTLRRVRAGQDAMRLQLEALERSIREDQKA